MELQKAEKEYFKKNKEQGNNYKTFTNMLDINPTISIITLNSSGLNVTKTVIVRVDQNTDPILYCLQEIHFRYKEKYTLLIVTKESKSNYINFRHSRF